MVPRSSATAGKPELVLKRKYGLCVMDALKDTSNGAWGAGTYSLTGGAEQMTVLHERELTKTSAVV